MLLLLGELCPLAPISIQKLSIPMPQNVPVYEDSVFKEVNKLKLGNWNEP